MEAGGEGLAGSLGADAATLRMMALEEGGEGDGWLWATVLMLAAIGVLIRFV